MITRDLNQRMLVILNQMIQITKKMIQMIQDLIY